MSFTSLFAHDRDPGVVLCVAKRVTFDTISRLYPRKYILRFRVGILGKF